MQIQNFEKLNDKGNIKGICEAINYFKKLMSENHEQTDLIFPGKRI